MSGLFSTSRPPTAPQNTFGMQGQRANTNQQARAVPLLYGTNRISVTFISDTFDLLAVPVNQSVGKTSEQTGNNYYASFAALCCHGPVDALTDIYLNGDPVYANTTNIFAVGVTAAGTPGDEFYTATFNTASPHGLQTGDVVIINGIDQPEFDGEFIITVISPTQFQYPIVPTDVTVATTNNIGYIVAQLRLPPVLRNDDNPDFADITIPSFGVMRIYWGTETQTEDAYLSETTGQNHPAYLGLCYVVFTQLFFGYNQTNVPNVELVLTRNPVPDWGTNEASPPSTTPINDANPAYVIADLFQNIRADLALPDWMLDTAALDDAASQFDSESFGVAQYISRDTDVRSTLATLCETIDAIPLLDANGLISLTYIRAPLNGVPDAVVTDGNLADLAQFSPSDWTTTYNQVRVVFNDQTLAYQDNALTWRDIGVLNVVKNPSILSLDRRWITRPDLANVIMQAAGQTAAIPLTTGKVKLRWDDNLFAALTVGATLQINSDFRDTGQTIFRVTARTIPDPAMPEFEVEFQTDLSYLYNILEPQRGGVAGSSTFSDSAPPPPVPPPLPAPPAYNRFRFIELPPGLCPGVPSLAALVARNSSTISTFSVWVKKNSVWSGTPPESYLPVQTFKSFAMHGLLTAAYPAATRNIDLELGAFVQFDGPDTTLNEITAFEALSDTLLVFVDDEIMSLAGWTLVAPALYRLQLVRGRFGTPIQSHAAGAMALLIQRSLLPLISNSGFQPDNEETLKMALGNQGLANAVEADLALCGAAFRVPAPGCLTVNGRWQNCSFPGGAATFTVGWMLPDPGALLPKLDRSALNTRLQFYVAPSAGSLGATADTNLLTADGGTIQVNPHCLVHQEDFPWDQTPADGGPQLSASFVFSEFGPSDRNFLVVASTVNKLAWKEVVSPQVCALRVRKYP